MAEKKGGSLPNSTKTRLPHSSSTSTSTTSIISDEAVRLRRSAPALSSLPLFSSTPSPPSSASSSPAGTTTTTAATPSWPIPLSPVRRIPRIVVIGGGVSGLACARSLQFGSAEANIGSLNKNDAEVIVIEARNRIGGRIHSIKFDDGSIGDLGASWIHGVNGNPISMLSKHASLTLGPLDEVGGPNNFAVYNDIDGKSYSDDIEKDFKEMVEILLKQSCDLDEKSRKVLPGTSLLSKWDSLLTDTYINKLARKYNMSNDTVIRLASVYRDGLEGYLAAPLANFSFNWFWDDHERNQQGGDRVVVNGYYHLIDYLANDLTIHTNVIVNKIRTITSSSPADAKDSEQPATSTVVIETERGNIEADYVVCTLPIGVLRSGRVEFNPPLPQHKLQAIDRFGWGTLDKVILRFKKCFWPVKSTWILCASPRPNGPSHDVSWFNNQYRSSGSPILVGFIHSSYAIQMESTPSVVVRHALEALSRTYGSDIVNSSLAESFVTSWATDPFALGSYTHVSIHGTPLDYEEMARCVGPLHFAGEATNRRWPCTVHGAYLSGAREARKLRDRIHDWHPTTSSTPPN